MAHTKTDYVLSAGFTPADILTKLGEVFAGLGLMANSTAWFDSFTDTSGSEVRILAMTYTGNSGTYDTVYHSFMTKSAYDGLWYTVYFNWNATTHQSDGTALYDHVSSYEHPDDLSTGSWANYYVCLALPSDASDYTITTHEGSSTETSLIQFHNSGESRLFYFLPTTTVTYGISDYNTYGPASLMSMRIYIDELYLGGTMFTYRTSLGYPDTGISGNDWQLNPLLGSHLIGGSVGETGLSVNASLASICGKPNMSRRSGQYRTPYYMLARNYWAAGPSFNAVFGENLAFIIGDNDNSFSPAVGDTLVVSAGVEEYEVLQKEAMSNWGEWSAILSRSV
jgi:hypothetical protein